MARCGRHVTLGAARHGLEALCGLCLPEADRFVFLATENSEALAAREWLASQGLARRVFSRFLLNPPQSLTGAALRPRFRRSVPQNL